LRRNEQDEVEEIAPLEENFPITILRRGSAGIPLFLIPGGMGTRNELMVFASLVRHFESDRMVYGFESPVMSGETDTKLSIKKLARDYLFEIKRIQPVGPYVICGECIAGVIAFEIAKQILKAGDGVARLILLDPIISTRKGARNFKKTGLERLEKAHGEDLSSRVFPYYLALMRYVPSKIRAATTVVVTQVSSDEEDKLETWRALTSGDLRCLEVAGSHDSYIREQGAQTGQLLGEIVDQTDRLLP
jgi:surfactin synthase thioesterase subunit